jgi:hypothetical protein
MNIGVKNLVLIGVKKCGYQPRMYRIPYCYLTNFEVWSINIYAWLYLETIRDIHNDIPNPFHRRSAVRTYQYYPSFLRWCFWKSVAEIERRGIAEINVALDASVTNLKSRRLADFIPPDDEGIAADVVFMMKANELQPENMRSVAAKLPVSYLNLAESIYGYTTDETHQSRICELSQAPIDFDADWYRV